MPVQTSVPTAFAVGYAGMRADTSPCDTLSAYNREGSALPFGLALIKGTGPNDVKKPTGATVAADLLGISEFTHAYKNYDLSGTDGIPVGGMVNLAKKGRYLVKVEEAVLVGDTAFVRIASGAGGTVLGSFRKSADTATAISWTGVKFLTAAAANGLAVIDLNLP